MEVFDLSAAPERAWANEASTTARLSATQDEAESTTPLSISASRRAAQAAEREGPPRDAFEALAGPERDRIRSELPDASKRFEELAGQETGHRHFQIAHPEAMRRLDRLDSEIAMAAWEMDVARQDLDGIPAQQPDPPALARGCSGRPPCWIEASISDSRERRSSPAPLAPGGFHRARGNARRSQGQAHGRRLHRPP